MQVERGKYYWRVYRSTRTGHYTWLGVRSDKKSMDFWEGLRRLNHFNAERNWRQPLQCFMDRKRANVLRRLRDKYYGD